MLKKKKNESDGPDARGETKSESDDKNGDAEDEPNVQTYCENNDSEHHYGAVPYDMNDCENDLWSKRTVHAF